MLFFIKMMDLNRMAIKKLLLNTDFFKVPGIFFSFGGFRGFYLKFRLSGFLKIRERGFLKFGERGF